MKRYLRWTVAAWAAVMCCMAAVSCSSDDGFSEEEYPARIVGLWKLTKEYSAEDKEWWSWDDPEEGASYYRFRDDGTGEEIEETESGRRYTNSIRYSLSGKTLTIAWGYSLSSDYEIHLSANELILIYKGDPDYDWEGAGDREYYKRVE